MKRIAGILVCTLAAGLAWAQNPQVIQKTRTTMNTVQKNAAAASNQALGITGKPAAGSVVKSPAVKPSAAPARAAVQVKKAAAVQAKPKASAEKTKPVAAKAKVAAVPKKAKPEAAPVASSANAETADNGDSDKDSADKKWSMTGKRDPFISPVVNHTGGSGCSTGKKCLEIGNINLRGVVRSDQGFIAVVTNSLNKAYFLRENDPVFDGYVVKITGDSVIFKETMQDRLGKTFTRDVVKKITTPAV